MHALTSPPNNTVERCLLFASCLRPGPWRRRRQLDSVPRLRPQPGQAERLRQQQAAPGQRGRQIGQQMRLRQPRERRAVPTTAARRLPTPAPRPLRLHQGVRRAQPVAEALHRDSLRGDGVLVTTVSSAPECSAHERRGLEKLSRCWSSVNGERVDSTYSSVAVPFGCSRIDMCRVLSELCLATVSLCML